MRRWTAALALLVGCGDAAVTPETRGTGTTGSSSDTSTSAGPSGGSTNEPPSVDASSSSGPHWETDGIGDAYETTGSCGFVCPPAAGTPPTCSLQEQDCPLGEKCAPFDPTGGSTWTSTACVPREAFSGVEGESCEYSNWPWSTVDTCGPGLWCSPLDIGDPKIGGTCRAVCGATLSCSDAVYCAASEGAAFGVCSAPCDPLAEVPCASPAEACVPSGLGFACRVSYQVPQGESCNETWQCEPGLLCSDSPLCNPEKAGEPCCTPVCDLSAPNCPDDAQCEPFGSPLSAYSDVGVCTG